MSAGFIVLLLFNQSLIYQKKTRQLNEAALVAENAMARCRAWAENPGNYASGWGPFSGSVTDPDHPGFQVAFEVDSGGRTVYTPSTNLEQPFAEADRRSIPAGLVPVRCRVSFPGDEFVLTSYVGAAVRQVDPATALTVTKVSGPGEPVPRDGLCDYQARVFDTSGGEIEGVTFSWSVVPDGGNAVILHDDSHRSGKWIKLQNKYHYNHILGTWGVQPGNIQLRATAVYNGIEMSGDSPVIILGGT
ncbi:MAG: hypothetical protein AB7J86_11775 [Vulcanimicrobiota bacterium]